jgi:hypothetical protein
MNSLLVLVPAEDCCLLRYMPRCFLCKFSKHDCVVALDACIGTSLICMS